MIRTYVVPMFSWGTLNLPSYYFSITSTLLPTYFMERWRKCSCHRQGYHKVQWLNIRHTIFFYAHWPSQKLFLLILWIKQTKQQEQKKQQQLCISAAQ